MKLHNLITGLALCAIAPALGMATARADTLIQEDWENGTTIGNPPWTVEHTQDTDDTDSVTVDTSGSFESPFTTGEHSVKIDNASTTTGSPALKGSFTAQTEQALHLRFDWRVGDFDSNAYTFFLYDDADTQGIQLAAINSKLRYYDGKDSHDLQSVSANTWYRIEITVSAANQSGDTFDLKVTPLGGTSQSYDDLGLKNELSNYASVYFKDNTPANRTSTFYVDNILVESAPEPGSLALLGLGGVMMLSCERKRGLHTYFDKLDM